MTTERQNEIWQELPKDFKEWVQREWVSACDAFNRNRKDIFTQSQIAFLATYFGTGNLNKVIEQAEEKPKEPRFKVGDKVRVLDNTPLVSNRGKIATIIKEGECCKGYGWVLDISKSVFLESELEPYTEPKKDVEISDENGQNSLDDAKGVEISTNEDAYFAYRLDLAKEIAVAMIHVYTKDYTLSEMGKGAVEIANKIIKRLKETEE